ncbi:Wd Repeat Domain Phosphoinositide-Interacting Protein 4 [Manis pentadactyla]|nr:Wd Repeat Domain Phosphoinositide-Interacting Protein 4 [Manis pentadactyla]
MSTAARESLAIVFPTLRGDLMAHSGHSIGLEHHWCFTSSLSMSDGQSFKPSRSSSPNTCLAFHPPTACHPASHVSLMPAGMKASAMEGQGWDLTRVHTAMKGVVNI